ncbi:SDR family NAD(P)-dependent oxidoreductase [Kineococcus glutinatus]|uniref:SDR family NAD(P)-dependent oxidoreductase n=1 Tax=Kineococcus glutinatus TaxID=1070872 RepID=A0ABP9HUK9_9ACTN
MTTADPGTTRPLALVTGASSGIGLELARSLARRGYDLVVAAEDAELHAAAAELEREGTTVAAVQVDLTVPGDVERLWDAVVASGRSVDVVALNAGAGVGGAFAETDLAAELGIIQLNCASTVHLAKRAVQAMTARGEGRVLVTSSLAARVPSAHQAVYAGTKAFVHDFAQSIGAELDGSGVTVTAFMPGPTHSEFFDRAGLTDTKLGASDAKDDPAQVAEQAVEALLEGKDHVVTGSLATKVSGALGALTPDRLGARLQGKAAEPGSAPG